MASKNKKADDLLKNNVNANADSSLEAVDDDELEKVSGGKGFVIDRETVIH